MLLLRSDPHEWDALAPEDIQRIMARSMAWGDDLRAQGREVSGEELEPKTSRMPRRDGAVQVLDGPCIETREAIGGYSLYTATDMDDAIAAARDCPALLHDATVEIVRVADHPSM